MSDENKLAKQSKDLFLSKNEKLLDISEITADMEPLKPLPPDELTDVYYRTDYQPKCNLCKSPLRTIAEHVFILNARKPQSVVNFFREYYSCKISWQCVENHMKAHCDLSRLGESGLRRLELREDIFSAFKFKELDLAINVQLQIIDDIEGISNCKTNEQIFKRAAILSTASMNLASLAEKRDALLKSTVSIHEVLMNIYNQLPDSYKPIITKELEEIQKRLMND